MLDFGAGQLSVATVRRYKGYQQGVEFEQRLVSDGNRGLCARRRVSPYVLAKTGLPAHCSACTLDAGLVAKRMTASRPAIAT